MAFPQTPLQVRVDLQLAGIWTDITSYALVRDAITISRGRRDEATSADPQSCALSLRNADGRFSPRNPTGAYYGLIGRNTPMRVGVGVPPVGQATGGQSGTNIVAPSVNAEVAGALFCVWGATPVGNITVPVSMVAGTERDGPAVSTWNGGAESVGVGATGTRTATFSLAATASAAISVFVPGSSISTVGFSSAVVAAGGGAVTLPSGAAAVGDYVLVFHGWSADPYGRMVDPPRDSRGACQWLLVADSGASPGPRVKAYITRVTAAGVLTAFMQTPVAGGGAETFARGWVITGATDYYPRFYGEVPEWPAKWDLSGKDVWSPVVASGITRRLGQGDTPQRSALVRAALNGDTIAAATLTPPFVGAWPCEDGPGARSLPPLFPTATSLLISGQPSLAAADGFAGSGALPTWTGASATARVAPYTAPAPGGFGAVFLVRFPKAGMTDDTVLLRVATTGTTGMWTISYRTTNGGSLQLTRRDTTGALIATSALTGAAGVDGYSFMVLLQVTQNGANTDAVLEWLEADGAGRFGSPGGVATTTQTDAGRTAGIVAGVTIGAGLTSVAGTTAAAALTGDPAIGQILVTASAAALLDALIWRAYEGWQGGYDPSYPERAVTRLLRLGEEENVGTYAPFVVSLGVTSPLMGAQQAGTLLGAARAVEALDLGILHECKGTPNLAYRERAFLRNQTSALTLSYTGGQISAPLEPTDDDQRVLNDVTTTRPNGSSARYILTAGTLSTAAPPAGVGRYDTSQEIQVQADPDLQNQAEWRVHVGTWDETRWPSVSVDLAKNPGLIPTMTALDVGDQVSLSGLPAWVPPGDGSAGGTADLLVEGYAEKLTPFGWDLTLVCGPAGVHRVFALDSAVLGRLDSADSTIAASVNSIATSFSVAVAAGSALWTTTATRPTDFPFNAIVGGEVVTVTAIVGVASPQTWTVTRSVNGVIKGQGAGAQIRLARPSVLSL